MDWLRSVDLAEYAPNLRGSGVHGALMVSIHKIFIVSILFKLELDRVNTAGCGFGIIWRYKSKHANDSLLVISRLPSSARESLVSYLMLKSRQEKPCSNNRS